MNDTFILNKGDEAVFYVDVQTEKGPDGSQTTKYFVNQLIGKPLSPFCINGKTLVDAPIQTPEQLKTYLQNTATQTRLEFGNPNLKITPTLRKEPLLEQRDDQTGEIILTSKGVPVSELEAMIA